MATIHASSTDCGATALATDTTDGPGAARHQRGQRERERDDEHRVDREGQDQEEVGGDVDVGHVSAR